MVKKLGDHFKTNIFNCKYHKYPFKNIDIFLFLRLLRRKREGEENSIFVFDVFTVLFACWYSRFEFQNCNSDNKQYWCKYRKCTCTYPVHVQVYDGRNVLPGYGRSGTVLPGYGVGFPGSGGLPWFRVVFLRVVVIAQDNQCIKFNLSEKN